MYDFRAPLARMGVPSLNHIVLSQNGTWHLPHGGASVQHRPLDYVFSETVGVIESLEFADGQMWGVGHVQFPGVAEALNKGLTFLSIEITEMTQEVINRTTYIDSGYIRAALLVSPAGYGWPV